MDKGNKTMTLSWGKAIKTERDKDKQSLEPLHKKEEEQSPPQ